MREDVVSSTIQLISDTAAVQPNAVYGLWEATKNLKNLEDFQPLVQVRLYIMCNLCNILVMKNSFLL
jgi:hypothetical protein